jgi:hypothetical protein
MTVYRDSKRIVGTNADRIGTPAISGGWKELARTTLGSAGDTISVSSLPDKRYYMILGHIENTGGDTVSHVRANSDSSANYALRRSVNAGADSTTTSDNRLFSTHNSKSIDSRFIQGYVANKSDKEKLGIFQVNENPSTGAGTAPSRIEGVGKHVQTSSALNELQLFNDEAGSFDTGGELVVLGWDPDDTHTTNFWEQLADVTLSSASDTLSSGTITAKKYLWVQTYTKATGGTVEPDSRFNGDSGTNYADRYSINGGSDGTGTSISQGVRGSGVAYRALFNDFIINNASNEKLVIRNVVYPTASGAGNAPSRRETVGKWANTSNQITSIDWVDNSGSGAQMDTDSFIKVWGSN